MAETGEGPVYTESSFLISLYSPDSHTAAAAAAMSTVRGPVIVTALVEFEVINALQQRVFWKQVTTLESRKSTEDFKGDLRNRVLQFEGLPESMFARARQIAERTTASLGTRSIDLLHVACALELGAAWLYSFDERQRTLAHAMRLKVNRI